MGLRRYSTLIGAAKALTSSATIRANFPSSLDDVERAVVETAADLESVQNAAGEWCFELKANVTIPAEYILLEHFLGMIDDAVERKLAVYLRAAQADHVGWPLFH